MILKRAQLRKIKEFVKRKVESNDLWHQLHHIKQTVKLSIALAKKEKADINKCVVAAWLHDIEKNEENNGKNHGTKGAEVAEIFLRKIGILKEDIVDVCHAIHYHNKGNKGERTITEQILWDADKLQAIGPYGILRDYGCSVAKGKSQEEAYRKNLEEQEFFFKRFNTKTAKKIAKKQFAFMKKFHEKYKIIEQAIL
jgi:uncharacterized protein